MKRGIFILHAEAFETIYGGEHRQAIAELVDIAGPPVTADAVLTDPAVLRDVELVFSGWGAPQMDAAFLAAAPELEAVFYGAGSVRGFVTDALWERGVVVSSAWAMNAVPVAEFTLSQILFSLKRGWAHAMSIARRGREGRQRMPVPGAYHTRVGIISLGAIGRLVCKLLRPFDVEVLACDPYVDDAVFDQLGVRRASLEEIFARCHVVSLHAPNLPSTRGMIAGGHFTSMPKDATFINTARGDIIREEELVAVLRQRPDLWAVLDVLADGDRGADPAIYDLPNVVLTPHIAGALDRERRRMGAAMVAELRRYLAGQPLQWQITRELLAHMA